MTEKTFFFSCFFIVKFESEIRHQRKFVRIFLKQDRKRFLKQQTNQPVKSRMRYVVYDFVFKMI